MSERNLSSGGRSTRPTQRDPGQQEPASGNPRQVPASRERQRASERQRAFNRIEEGDEGQGEWESSARSNEY